MVQPQPTRTATRRALCGALLATTASSCGGAVGDTTDTRTTEAPSEGYIANAPFVGPSAGNSLPPLNTGEPNSSGSFSTFAQLAEQPQDISPQANLDSDLSSLFDPGSKKADAWRAFVAGDAFTTPPMMSTQVERALTQARALSETGNDLLALMQALRDTLPNQDSTLFPKLRLLSYRPERARWLSEQRDGVEFATYPPPPGLDELRHRGERLYCAVKNAARRQQAAPQSVFMGKYDLIEIPVFKIPILTVEPTLAIREPTRHDSGQNDGAQAFMLPFEAGVRTSIFPALLPLLAFPEMKLPVNAMVADSEVQTPVDFGQGKSMKVMTATHAMAFASSGFEGTAESNDIPLPIKIGPIGLSVRVGLMSGMTTCSEHGPYADCRNNIARPVGRLISGVQSGMSGPVLPFAPGARGLWDGFQTNGWTKDPIVRNASPYYNDAPWNVDTQLWQATVPNTDLVWFPTRLPDPLAARMVQNNDKSFMVETKYGLTMALIARAGLRLPETGTYYVQFSADVNASFTLGTSVLHRFREQEELQVRTERAGAPEFDVPVRAGAPVTSLTVTPGTQLEPIRLDLSGALDIGVYGGPFKIGYRVKLFRVGTNAGDAGTPHWWPESHRLRLNTMMSYKGQVEDAVTSHLPGSGEYPTFEDRATCAAPHIDPPAPRERCKAAPERTSQAYELPMCAVAAIREVAPDEDRNPQLACYLRIQGWLHTGTYMEQSFHGERVVARVIPTAEWADFARTAIDCASEYARVGANPEDSPNYFRPVPCEASGVLREEPIAPSFASSAPEPNSASAPCR